MRLQNFDASESALDEFIDFCERFEQIETTEGEMDRKSNTQTSKIDKKSENCINSDDESGNDSKKSDDLKKEHCCMSHDENATHNAEQCHSLKNYAKKQKETSETNSSSQCGMSKEEIHAVVKGTFQNIKAEKKQKHLQEANHIGEELNHLDNIALSDDSENDSEACAST